MNILLKNKDEKIIFIASCAMKLFFIAVVLWQGGFFQPFSQIQSDGYLPLAVNLYEHHAFSYSTTTPYAPEALQVPGYPLFLSVMAAPFGSVIPALIVQMVLMSYSAVLLYKLFEGYFSARVRFWAALLYGIEPFASFTSAMALSESLFMFLFLLALFLLRGAVEERKLSYWGFAGFIMGASILVRPIGMYLYPLLLLVIASVLWRYKKYLPAAGIAVSLLCFALLPGTWMIRNFQAFGVATIATKGPYTLYFFDVGQLLEYQGRLTPTEVDQELFNKAKADNPEIKTHDDLRNPRYASYLDRESLAYIRQDLPLFLKLQTLSLATFFFSDGYRLLLEESGAPIAPLPNITKSIAQGQYATLSQYLMSNPGSTAVFVLGTLFWASMTLAAAISIFIAWYKHEWNTLIAGLFLAFMMAYFSVLTGPVAQARYRIVIEPFLFILGMYTLSQLYVWYKRRLW